MFDNHQYFQSLFKFVCQLYDLVMVFNFYSVKDRFVNEMSLLVATSWGYMVKRLSAHGGCLGNKRR